jgi:putative two-component system response regulator
MAGEAIPLSARLMALADVYDALRSQRVYKPAYSHERATPEILEGRGTHFDPDVVDVYRTLGDEFVTIARTYTE